MTALRVAHGPRVDGRLDDPAWQETTVYGGFTQRLPAEGHPVTEETEVRIVYDDEALYVAFRCHDRQARHLRRRLARRDALPATDWVAVLIDAPHDRKTAVRFLLSLAGDQADAAFADGATADSSWDGVWQGATHIDDRGWSAELRIPFATLRFPRRQRLIFGIHVQRLLNRRHELSEWHLIGSDATAFVGDFATLHGLAGVRPGLRLQLLPHALLQVSPSYAAGSLAPRKTVEPGGGLDLKYGLTGRLTLDLTVNPDFGQVEVDPAVINLTAIETFYPERRPFFAEGAELFRTPLLLLHTRRIGAPPPGPEARRDDGTIVSVDALPRIYGAAKVTGHVAAGTQVGLLSALVGPAEAVEEGPGGETSHPASPLSHYGAARVRQQLGGPSSVGLLTAMVQRHDPEDALPSSPTADHYVSALDLDLRGHGPNTFAGQVVVTPGTCDEDREARGAACVPVGGYFITGRTGGERLRASLYGRFLPPDLDYNDTGYQPVRDSYLLSGNVTWRTPRPWWRTLNTESSLYAYYAWNTAGYRTDTGVGLSSYAKWRSLWESGCTLELGGPRYDPLETRYGRFPYYRTWTPWGSLTGGTNSSRPLSAQLTAIAGYQGGALDLTAGPSVTLLAGSRVQLRLGVAWHGYRDRPRWVSTETVGEVDHYVFGDLDYDSVDATLRLTVVALSGLTVQLYGQLLHAAGRYPGDRYRELTAPRELGDLTIPFDGDAAFTHTSLISNLVVRWEYRPLSVVYLVWTHASAFDASGVVGSTQPPGDFGLGDALRDLWHVEPSDVIMLKLSYLYQL